MDLVNYQRCASLMCVSTPWDISRDEDPISMFIVLSSSTYEHCVRTGCDHPGHAGGISVCASTPSSVPESHLNDKYAIVEHALTRITNKELSHSSNILVRLKVSPAPLIKQLEARGVRGIAHHQGWFQRHRRSVSLTSRPMVGLRDVTDAGKGADGLSDGRLLTLRLIW